MRLGADIGGVLVSDRLATYDERHSSYPQK